MTRSKWLSVSGAALLATLSLAATIAEAAGTLTIGRREDGTTFDPIKSAQNVDFWVFSNVYDVLVRVDKSGTKLEPGLAEKWEVSPDGKVVDEAQWQANIDQWLPSAEDRAFVASLMGRVVEPGKFANWITPPAMGINRQPIDFEYVRFN